MKIKKSSALNQDVGASWLSQTLNVEEHIKAVRELQSKKLLNEILEVS